MDNDILSLEKRTGMGASRYIEILTKLAVDLIKDGDANEK